MIPRAGVEVRRARRYSLAMTTGRSRVLAIALLLASLASAPPAFARDELIERATDVAFDRSPTVGGATYECLGTGVRRFLVFKVYAIAFCIEASRAEATVREARVAGTAGGFLSKLASTPADKLAVLRLLRDVPASRMAGAFRDNLSDVLSAEKIEKLIATIPGDAQGEQSVLLYSSGTKLMIDIAGNRREIDDEEIASKLWLVWLGAGSVTPTLREDIAERAGF